MTDPQNSNTYLFLHTIHMCTNMCTFELNIPPCIVLWYFKFHSEFYLTIAVALSENKQVVSALNDVSRGHI